MKTFQLTSILLISLSIISGCKKTSVNPATDPASSAAKTTYTGYLAKFIKPANFVSGVNNPYFPLTPGDTFYYQVIAVEDGDTTVQDVTISVTNDTYVIQGIACMVVHDQVKEDNVITEDTYDWYAQDIFGTVWYFGESTQALQDDGTWSTEGSFESGVDGAMAGFIMPYDPGHFIGDKYRQEHYEGHAEDNATVISTDETVTIGLGTFTHCVKTEETTPLEPGVKENKWYAPGVGQIKSSITIGADEQEELIGTN